MLKKIFPTIFLLLFFNYLHAQNDKELSYNELDSIVDFYYEEGNYEKSIFYIKKAIQKTVTESGKENARYAQYINDLGLFYDLLGQYSVAEPYYLEAVEIGKKTLGEWHEKYAESLNNLADLYTTLGRYKEAEPLFLKSIEINKKALGESHHEYGGFVNNLSRLYETMGRYEEAEKLYKQVAEIDRKSLGENHPFYGASLHNLANINQRMGHYEEAESFYLQAKAIRAKAFGEDHPTYAITLHNLAVLYQSMNKKEESELMFLQAKEIRKKALGELHPYYAATLEQLARLYQEKKQYGDAKILLEQCLYIIEKTLGKSHYTYASVLEKIALTYNNLGDLDKAEKAHLQAINIYKNIFGEQHPSRVGAIVDLGGFYKDLKNYDKALELYFHAQELYEKAPGKSQTAYASLFEKIATVFLLKNQLNEAYNFSISSIVLNAENFEKIFPSLAAQKNAILNGNCPIISAQDFLKFSQLKVLSNIHLNASIETLLKVLLIQKKQFENDQKTELAQEKLQSYYNLSKAAILINEQAKNEFSLANNKLILLTKKHSFIDAAINGAIQLKKPQYIEEVFQFAEQNKSALLADALKGNRARAMGDLPDSLAFLEINLQLEKDHLKKQKEETDNPQQKAAIIIQENQLHARIDAFLESLKDKYPKYHALRYEDITSKATDIQKLLGQETLLLEYFVSESKTYLFVLSKNTVNLMVIPILKQELNSKIRVLRDALTDLDFINHEAEKNYTTFTETAFWFYQNIVAPAFKNIPATTIKNLIIIADGELGHLPFETFLDKKAPAQYTRYDLLEYLVKKYNINYNYSATLFANAQQKQKNSINNGSILACVSDYNPINYLRHPSDSSLLKWRLPYLFNARKALSPLPEAEKEVTVLEQIFQGKFLKGEAANEAFFKKHAAEYEIIHLAMHGILHEREPILSSLAFTENRDSLEDNFLQAYEISRLDLNANLVVLSACETGFGKFEQGEGVMSLARSFMYAGVPSLVVSLWQVNDYSTAEIMKAFYLHLADGMSKDAALRLAKLDYIQRASGIAAHPSFWSAFIQLGDYRPIEIARKTNWKWWGFGGILLLVGGGFLFRKRKIVRTP